MITIRLELGKLNRDRIYVSPKTNRKYMSFILVDNPDRFGNDGEVLESLSKEERAVGVKAGIVGNWKELRAKPSAPEAKPPAATAGEGLFDSPEAAYHANRTADAQSR